MDANWLLGLGSNGACCGRDSLAVEDIALQKLCAANALRCACGPAPKALEPGTLAGGGGGRAANAPVPGAGGNGGAAAKAPVAGANAPVAGAPKAPVAGAPKALVPADVSRFPKLLSVGHAPKEKE